MFGNKIKFKFPNSSESSKNIQNLGKSKQEKLGFLKRIKLNIDNTKSNSFFNKKRTAEKKQRNEMKKYQKLEKKKQKAEMKLKQKLEKELKKESKIRARNIEKQKRKDGKKRKKGKIKHEKQKEQDRVLAEKNKKTVKNDEKEKIRNLHLDIIKKVEELNVEKPVSDEFTEETQFSIDTTINQDGFELKPVDGPEFCLTNPFDMNVGQKQEILEKMGSVKTSKAKMLGLSNESATKMMQAETRETVLPKEDVSNISAKEKIDTPLIDETIAKGKDKPSKDKNKKKNQEKYIYTSIKGFDTLLEKGIPTGANIIVAGGPGCGKTIFCSQTIYNKAAEGRDCVFLSMEERPDRLRDHMLSFGFNVEEIERSEEQIILRANGKGRISLKRLQPIRLARSIEALLEKASGTLPVDIDLVLDFIPEDFDACLLALDSISAIETAFSGTKRQYRIYIEQLFRYFEEMNLTTFMITESSDAPHKFSNTGVEEFLADGIFVFYNFQGVKKRTRGVEVYKLRGASHSQRIVPMKITSNGMKIDSDESCKGQAQS